SPYDNATTNQLRSDHASRHAMATLVPVSVTLQVETRASGRHPPSERRQQIDDLDSHALRDATQQPLGPLNVQGARGHRHTLDQPSRCLSGYLDGQRQQHYGDLRLPLSGDHAYPLQKQSRDFKSLRQLSTHRDRKSTRLNSSHGSI